MIAYALETTLLLGVFYFTFLIMKNEKWFVFNRFYILFSLMASAVIPFIDISVGAGQQIPTATYLLDELTVTTTESLKQTWITWEMAPTLFYLFISLIIAWHLVIQIIHIRKLIRRNDSKYQSNCRIVELKGSQTHFSFFRTIFINQKATDNEDDLKRIIKHEKTHVDQLHSLDVILLELIKVFSWFNPFVWLFKPVMMHNHEYLADQHVLQQGEDKATYLDQIVRHTLTNYNVAMVNNFNYSITKRRIIMMTKENSKVLSGIKLMLVVPIVLGSVVFFSCSESITDQNKEEFTKSDETNPQTEHKQDDTVFTVVETMPEFPGGTEKMMQFLISELNYPADAKSQEIQGTVFVQFVVDKSGEVRDARILRGVHPSLDAEALRVVNGFPEWQPGVQRGEAVSVQFNLPVRFALD